MDTSIRIIGIDIGGTKCAVVSAATDGTIISRKTFLTQSERGPTSILKELVARTRDVYKEAIVSGVIQGIGISCGGPIDAANGLICDPPNLPGWHDIPIRYLFETEFPRIPVIIENDANATALAEWKFGAGRGTSDMIFMTMGTGIGGGLICGGQLVRGTNDLAGEVGHQTIIIDGPECQCGKRGCLEALASGPAIARQASELLANGATSLLRSRASEIEGRLTARDVVDCAKRGDESSIALLDRVGAWLGVGIANLIMILNPERVIIGTIAVHAGELILDPVRRAVTKHAWTKLADKCSIVPAELGDRAQDLAAVSLIQVPGSIP